MSKRCFAAGNGDKHGRIFVRTARGAEVLAFADLSAMVQLRPLTLTGFNLGLERKRNRRALYERARAALLAQLRGVTPPLNESDITRERLALEESIREHVKSHLAPYQQPRKIEFVAELPMTTTGKVQRKVLREREAAVATSSDQPRV